MPSSWIIRRRTASGPRYRVLYRAGGREARQRYAGSFPTRTQALARKRWVDGELAALRVPNLGVLKQEPVRAPTLAEAAERWRESRVDVAEQTAKMHRSGFVRIFKVRPELGSCRIDQLGVSHVADLIAEPAHGDHPSLPCWWGAALLTALASSAAGFPALQAHGFPRRGC